MIEALVGTAREFAEHELRPVALAYDESEEFPHEQLTRAATLGLTCYDLPSEYGGGGVDFWTEEKWGDATIHVEVMVPKGMAVYARLCGVTLARAHARSGDRIAIAAYVGSSPSFQRTLVSFAESYADQNQRDFDALRQAVADGRISAQTGV